MGPWLVFAALLNGATLALFQGSPLGRDFGVFIEAAGVSMLGLVPSIAKAWRASDCMKVRAGQSRLSGCALRPVLLLPFVVLVIFSLLFAPQVREILGVLSHSCASC